MLIEQKFSSEHEPLIVVVGAGIAGLAAANKLRELSEEQNKKIRIVVFESSNRAGGIIKTNIFDKFVVESGPDSFLTKEKAGLDLCNRLGLAEHIINTNSQKRKTFVAHKGQLEPLPEGFVMLAPTKLMPLAGSKLLSIPGKWRAAMEMFVPKSANMADESLADFITRRFGKELYDNIAEPMVSGIYTGDGSQLSAKAALPYFWDLEQQFGSIINGICRDHPGQSKSVSGARYGMFVSLDRGMELLTKTIVNKLPENAVRLVTAVKQIKKISSEHKSKWKITLKNFEELIADAVIIATPAFRASEILQEQNSNLAAALKSIPYSSAAVINMVFDRADIRHPLNGFGFVVPQREKSSILACSFSSVKFANRTPADKVLLRAFIGGVLNKDIYELSDAQIECIVWQDLHKYLGIDNMPNYSLITRFPNSMPQYNVGHQEIVDSINNFVKETPGLMLAGNSYAGVGIPSCIASGEQAANSVFFWLESQK